MDRHHVYLLIDPADDSIFYIGQGVGTRAASHEADAKEWDANGRPPLPELGNKSPEERRAKFLKILELAAANPPRHPRVEFLRADLSAKEADLIETAAIDLIGLHKLTNQVHGPAGTGRLAAPLYEKLSKATRKPLTRPALIVPTSGVRGAVDPHGGMVVSDSATALANAETCWKVNPLLRQLLKDRGETPTPVLLVGLQSGADLPKARGVVIGIWEIEDCVYDGEKLEAVRDKATKEITSYREVPGYKFVVKDEPSSDLLELRSELLGHRLLDAAGGHVQANLGPVGINKEW